MRRPTKSLPWGISALHNMLHGFSGSWSGNLSHLRSEAQINYVCPSKTGISGPLPC